MLLTCIIHSFSSPNCPGGFDVKQLADPEEAAAEGRQEDEKDG
jgi:hypothetical protein